MRAWFKPTSVVWLPDMTLEEQNELLSWALNRASAVIENQARDIKDLEELVRDLRLTHAQKLDWWETPYAVSDESGE